LTDKIPEKKAKGKGKVKNKGYGPVVRVQGSV